MSFVIVTIFVGIVFSIVYASWRNGISPMPSSPKAKRAIISLLPENVHGTIYELGSGWGTLVWMLARHYPNHRIIGYETSLIPYLFSRLALLFLRFPNVEIRRHDFFAVELTGAGLVVCYLYPKAMEMLTSKFFSELTPGCVVVSNTFALPGWVPDSSFDIGDVYHSKVYRYTRD